MPFVTPHHTDLIVKLPMKPVTPTFPTHNHHAAPNDAHVQPMLKPISAIPTKPISHVAPVKNIVKPIQPIKPINHAPIKPVMKPIQPIVKPITTMPVKPIQPIGSLKPVCDIRPSMQVNGFGDFSGPNPFPPMAIIPPIPVAPQPPAPSTGHEVGISVGGGCRNDISLLPPSDSIDCSGNVGISLKW